MSGSGSWATTGAAVLVTRLALDHPGRVEKLATLDIISTWDMWTAMDARLAMRAWHWPFLAQPAPLPELLLGKAADEYFDLLTSAWKRGNGNAFDERAIAHYRASFTDPLRIHAGWKTIVPDSRRISSTTMPTGRLGRKLRARCWCFGARGACRARTILTPGALGPLT